MLLTLSLPKGFPTDELNHLALDRMNSVSVCGTYGSKRVIKALDYYLLKFNVFEDRGAIQSCYIVLDKFAVYSYYYCSCKVCSALMTENYSKIVTSQIVITKG